MQSEDRERQWNRDTTSRLVSSIPSPTSSPISSTSSTMGDQQNPHHNVGIQAQGPRPLRDYMYPTRAAQPSCIVLPPTNAHNFEIKTGTINMLAKFAGKEDPYLFIREFEEVCATLRIQQLTNDSIR